MVHHPLQCRVSTLSTCISTTQQEKVKQLIGKCVNKTTTKKNQTQKWDDCPLDIPGLKLCCTEVGF